MSVRDLLVILGCLACCPQPELLADPPTATDPGAQEPPTGEQIARWIDALAADNFAARETASRELWAAGTTARPALEQALSSDDPEVVRRVRKILAQLRWGIFADTPEAVVEVIDQYRYGDWQQKRASIDKLLAMGERAYPSLMAILAAEPNADIRAGVLEDLGSKIPAIARQLLIDGKFQAARQFLALAVDSGRDDALRNYAAFLSLEEQLEGKIQDLSAAGPASDPRSAKTLAYLLRAKGDLPRACTVAQHGEDARLVESLEFEQGRWEDLMRRSQHAFEESGTIEKLGFQAAYQRLSGQQQSFEQSIGMIRSWLNSSQHDRSELWYCAEALLLNDRSAEAISLLREQGNHQAAGSLLAAQLNFTGALDLIERQDKKGDGLPPRLEVLLAEQLHKLGEIERSEQIFNRLAETLHPEREHAVICTLVEAEYKLGLVKPALEHLAAALTKTTDEDQADTLLSAVFSKRRREARFWWRYLALARSHETPADRVLRLQRLLEMRLPADELEKLSTEAAARVDDVDTGIDRWERLETIADTCHAAGNWELASRYYRAAVDWDPPGDESRARLAELVTKLADRMTEQRQWQDAADQYWRAYELNRDDPVPLYLHGWALTKTGRQHEGSKQSQLAHIAPLADDSIRNRLAAALDRHGLAEAANRERELILRTGRFGSWERGNSLVHLGNRAFERRDFFQAADLHEQYLLGVLRASSSFVKSEAYLILPHAVHKARARGYLAAGDIDHAMHEARICLATLPGDVDLPVAMVPELEQQGRAAEAESLFDAVFQTYADVCQSYPKAAVYHNQLAWLAARCRRRLDLGLAHAQTAVRLMPDRASYLDTLAEVHFQRGQRARAVELMRRCVELDADNAYFARQLRRFAELDPASKPQ